MASRPRILIWVAFFFFFEFVFCESVVDPDAPECTNRWIHIRRLPTRFNLDLLTNCSEYPVFDDFCPYLANHGLGQKTHNNSHSWYRTDPLMLELVFHRRMLEYPCLTSDPSAADAIFLPYYGGIDAIRYLFGPEVNSSFEHGLELYEFLQQDSPEVWSRNGGHDHFTVLARPAWDFSQSLDNDPPIWGTSFLELPEFYNITVLTLESRPWPWQEQAIPYPTSFHPVSLVLLDSWVQRVRRSRRTTLMLFAGGGGRPCCRIFAGALEVNAKIVAILKIVLESQASFCLQPPGDTPTRRSTFDGILAGCIPVFFEDLTAKSQYGWHLPREEFGEFSVFIPKEDVVFGGQRILDVLMGIPRAEVRRMREKVMELMPKILYRKHGSSLGLRTRKDAFDIAVDGTIDRIKSRLEKVSLQ
ncbi:putative xyloglucan galactosyltransferase GT19 [Vitis vinifera]|uniref:Putative xyloglucan galactosyltransferase GT19 n=1 Tax=Vitis vinifera TaxID=29760 RepID=A0A438K2H2_VITVI|nr:putative xyloglucan galactosyltransferase GT19 [Vitis vinifera]